MRSIILGCTLAVAAGCAGSTMVVQPGYEGYSPASGKLLVALVGDVRFVRLRGGPFGPDESQHRRVGTELCEHLDSELMATGLFEQTECFVLPSAEQLRSQPVSKGREQGELRLPVEGASLQHGETPAATVLLLDRLHLRMLLRGQGESRSWTLHARGWYALWDNEQGQLAAYDLLDARYDRLMDEPGLERFAGSFTRSVTRAFEVRD